MIKQLLISAFFIASGFCADATSIINKASENLKKTLTLTRITFNLDEAGNLNPNLFVPLYYGERNQFYSSIAYDSSNFTESKPLRGFTNSKKSLVRNSKNFTLNYITYVTPILGTKMSFGLESTFSSIKKNEFGYIHDSDAVFNNSHDYYIAFDNNTKLNIQTHSLRADIEIPIGDYFSSRIFASFSPYTNVNIDQSTIFKPLIVEEGMSSSSNSQDISYRLRYDALIHTGTFINIGLEAYYGVKPLKYNIAQIAYKNNKYLFQTKEIDIQDTTTRFVGKLLFDFDVLGGLNPSLGYGLEKIKTKDNISGNTVSIDKKIIIFGVEKLF